MRSEIPSGEKIELNDQFSPIESLLKNIFPTVGSTKTSDSLTNNKNLIPIAPSQQNIFSNTLLALS
jgi:hypothetical protein